MTIKTGLEQRRFSRMPFKKAIKFRPKDAGSFSGRLAQDLSRGGIRLVSEEFLPIGASVMVQVQLADQGQVLDLPAKVVWVKSLAHAETYQVGLEFDADAAFAKWQIAKHIGAKT